MQTLDFESEGAKYSLAEGIHFGLPAKAYHSIPALSASGIKNILISAPDFYFNSWLNPHRAEDAEDQESKEWKRFGDAAHMRVLEGKAVFDSQYCLEFVPPPGCLESKAQLIKACDDAGVPVKESWTKDKIATSLLIEAPHSLIYDREKARYDETVGKDKKQFDQKTMRRIEMAAAMIELNPEINYLFRNGHSEVTILWQQDGIWFKARFDYLQPGDVTDLKTFSNPLNKDIDQVIHEQLEYKQYHVQAYFYLLAVQKAVQFSRNASVHIWDAGIYLDSHFLRGLADSKDHNFNFVFWKKGGAPLARSYTFGRDLQKMREAEALVQHGVRKFLIYLQRFGDSIWVDTAPKKAFVDDDFPNRRLRQFEAS